MAEQVIFGKTFKRINSISKVYDPIVTTEVTLKEPCSITAPAFVVKQDYKTMRECNYAEYAGFYYYIDNVVSIRNKHVMVQCHRDPLATFADAIKDTTAYAVYADLSHCDTRLNDPRMTPDVILKRKRDQINMGSVFDSEGCYIIQGYSQFKHSGGADAAGFCTWVLTRDQFATVLGESEESWISDVTSGDLIGALAKIAAKCSAPGSFKDSICDVFWVPTAYSSLTAWLRGSMNPFCLGGYVSPDVTAFRSRDAHYIHQFVIAAPQNPDWPDTHTQLPWLKMPTYTGLQLQYPGGALDISSPRFVEDDGFVIKVLADMVNGTYDITVLSQEQVLSIGSCSMKVSFMHYMQGNLPDESQFLASAAGRAFISSLSSGASMPVTRYSDINETDDTPRSTATYTTTYGTGIIGAFLPPSYSVSVPRVQAPNGLLGLTRLNYKLALTQTFAVPAIMKDGNVTKYNEWCALYGYPCNSYLKLGDVNGFVQCAHASIAAEGPTQAELSTMNSMVNSGIYIEE